MINVMDLKILKFFNDDKFNSINTNNLWYCFLEKDVMKTDIVNEEKKYTKNLISLMDDISDILIKYNIEIKVYFDEEDE